MPKSLDDYFTDWESNTFGFGYGTGEQFTLPALKSFFDICHEEGTYDYQELERALTPTVAWLLINTLAGCNPSVLDYGTSPRYGWLSSQGKALRVFVCTKTEDELYDLTAGRTEDYIHCYPNACNCGPYGYKEGHVCDNPFWAKA